ncbi:hypothetical protein [Mumia sp. DW29H23]|uniref:hypothetical protein n=1 Tax=Mumia sp. DW29H23 TaxID=3421241 RepID=UPI003D6949B8
MRSRLAGSAADQLLSSTSNSLILLTLARSMDLSEFGTVAVAYSFFAFALAVQRNTIGVPLQADLPTEAHGQPLIARSMAASAGLGGVVGVLVLAGSVVLPTADAVVMALLAATIPVALAQDCLRFAATSSGRPSLALGSDVTWFVATAVGFVLSVARGVPPAFLLALWLGGAVAALVVIWLGLSRPPLRVAGVAAMLREPRRVHLASESAASASTGLVLVNGLALVAGTATVGAFRAASTLFGPLGVVASFLIFGVGPEMSRTDHRGRRRLAVLFGSASALLALAWGWILAVNPYDLGTLLLGDTWSSVRDLVPVFAVQAAGFGVLTAFSTQLRIAGCTKVVMRMLTGHAVVAVTATLVVGATIGTAMSVATVLAALNLATAALSGVLAHRYDRGQRVT